tara:strand:+ start:557 stop:1210 length:654 start_codon:yes stop_codon:yes gene_type:complete
MSKPLISVVVTAYNEEKYIGRCLRSLIYQNVKHFDYEIIVVDDASNDRTPYALSLFHENIIVISNDKNLGLPASVNKAINKSKGKYILRTDADDYVNENYINFLYHFLLFNKQYDAVCCDYFEVNNNEKIIRKCNSLKKPIACGIMWKKKQLIELGMYDETFLCNEEIDLRIRFEKKHNMGHLEIPLYRYRKHKNNITKNKQLMKKHRLRLNEKHKI